MIVRGARGRVASVCTPIMGSLGRANRGHPHRRVASLSYRCPNIARHAHPSPPQRTDKRDRFDASPRDIDMTLTDPHDVVGGRKRTWLPTPSQNGYKERGKANFPPYL